MTWRWNAFSMRFTLTRPSRTRRELSREGIVHSCANHVRSSDPVLEAALLAVEAHPQESEEQRRDTGEVARTTRGTARRRRALAIYVDDADLEQTHSERAPEDDVEHEQVRHADRGEQHETHEQRRIRGEHEIDPQIDVHEL